MVLEFKTDHMISDEEIDALWREHDNDHPGYPCIAPCVKVTREELIARGFTKEEDNA